MKTKYLCIISLLLAGGILSASELPPEYIKAISLIETGRRSDASAVLKTLTDKYPEWGLFYLEYAANCIYLECPDDEIEKNLEKAQKLLVDNPRFYFYRGLFLEHKNTDEALKSYDKAISLKPDYTDVLIRACMLYAEKNDFKSAISYYDSVPADKRNSALVLKIINLLVQNKSYGRAEKELLWLVRNHPLNELYLRRLLELYDLTGNKDKAKEVLKRLQTLNPEKKKIMRPLK